MQTQTAQVGSITVQVPDDKGILVCQICKANLGVFDPETIHLPITPDQFESLDPKHGMWRPFQFVPGRPDSHATKLMKCPVCKRFPFLSEEVLLTPFGYFNPGKDRAAPRKRTQADDRQDAIEEAWAREQRKVEASLNSISERNQAEINRLWEEQAVEGVMVSEPDRVMEDAAGRNQFFRRRPGRPKKNQASERS